MSELDPLIAQVGRLQYCRSIDRWNADGARPSVSGAVEAYFDRAICWQRYKTPAHLWKL